MSLTKKATDPYTYHSEYLLCSTNLYKNHIAYLNLKLSTQDTCNQCTWDEFKFTLKSESMVLNWCASYWQVDGECLRSPWRCSPGEPRSSAPPATATALSQPESAGPVAPTPAHGRTPPAYCAATPAAAPERETYRDAYTESGATRFNSFL